MKKGTLRNSYIIESGKKIRNKKNEKTTSTEVDSNSQKGNSSSNLKNIYTNGNIKTKKNQKIFEKNVKKESYIYLPINELKQFRTWNCSNLNAIYQNILANS